MFILNKEINLLNSYNNIKKLCTAVDKLNTILLIILVFLIVVLFIYIWYKLHSFFVKEIIKRFLFITANEDPNNKDINNSAAIKLLKIREKTLWKLQSKVFHKIQDICGIFYKQIKDERKILKIESWLSCKIVFSIPTYFIIGYFVYELFYNNYTLSTTYNKTLFIYGLYMIYVRISNFTYYTDSMLNVLIFNMYYRFWSIKYVNIPENWQNIIYKYVEDGLYRDIEKQYDPDFDDIGGDFFIVIDIKHTYTTKDGKCYKNQSGEYFIEENNDSKDVV